MAVGEGKAKSGGMGNDAIGYDQVRESVKDGGEELRQRVLKEA